MLKLKTGETEIQDLKFGQEEEESKLRINGVGGGVGKKEDEKGGGGPTSLSLTHTAAFIKHSHLLVIST